VAISNELVDRRNTKRFRIKEGSFAALLPHSNKLGQIADLSKGGLSFLYLDMGEGSNESSELDIYVAGDDFYLSKLAVKTVSDIRIPNKIPINPVVMRRCGVQFGDLAPEQTSSLDLFVQTYANGEI